MTVGAYRGAGDFRICVPGGIRNRRNRRYARRWSRRLRWKRPTCPHGRLVDPVAEAGDQIHRVTDWGDRNLPWLHRSCPIHLYGEEKDRRENWIYHVRLRTRITDLKETLPTRLEVMKKVEARFVN